MVSDSYDLYNAVEHLWGEQLRQDVIDSGSTLVVRPDSGDPVEVVSKTLHLLAERFGADTNGKGYRVLKTVRVIQGDGVNPVSIQAILDRMLSEGFSASNIAFGMGGALLQKCDRDTLAFAYKASAAKVNGRLQGSGHRQRQALQARPAGAWRGLSHGHCARRRFPAGGGRAESAGAGLAQRRVVARREPGAGPRAGGGKLALQSDQALKPDRSDCVFVVRAQDLCL